MIKRLNRKDIVHQRNSKTFKNFMERLFPNTAMSVATEELSKDLLDAITFGKDIGKKYKRLLKNEKK